MWAKLVEFLINRIVVVIVGRLTVILPQLINDWVEKKKRERAQQASLEKLEEKLKDPVATKEEKAKANEDYFNS